MRGVVDGKALRPCGTWPAYQRHMRNREEPCEACKAANAAHVAAWRSDRVQEEMHRQRNADVRYG